MYSSDVGGWGVVVGKVCLRVDTFSKFINVIVLTLNVKCDQKL